MIVRIAHLRGVPGLKNRPGFCAAGARQWAAANGIVWRDFVNNGVDAEVLLATGDPLAQRLVEHARKVEMHDGQR